MMLLLLLLLVRLLLPGMHQGWLGPEGHALPLLQVTMSGCLLHLLHLLMLQLVSRRSCSCKCWVVLHLLAIGRPLRQTAPVQRPLGNCCKLLLLLLFVLRRWSGRVPESGRQQGPHSQESGHACTPCCCWQRATQPRGVH